MSRQDFPKAVDYLQRATRICIEAKLETHPDCARYWQNLSPASLRLGKFNDADAANAQSLRLRRALYGEQHPAYAGSLAGRAAIQLAQSKPAAALATIDQALAIMLGKGQSASLGGASMRKTRAQALKNLHRYPEALTDLNHADTLMQQQAPSDMEFQMQSITLRAEILDEDGRIEQARDLARKALKLGVPRTVITEERWQRLEAMAR
jgi:tetratricopeptide (TPR) repeat protein